MIDKYLISNCLFIIDEFNDRYQNIHLKGDLKDIADLEFCEADLVVRLGYPFRQMANFNMQGSAKDIVVKSKDFIIEVKYLRNFYNKTNSGNFRSNKLKWSEGFQKDFDWLCKEIETGKKGSRAFILGWFNAFERFSDIMQIGQGKGQNPIINQERINLFPFLNFDPQTNKVNDITYMYSLAYKELNIRIPGYAEEHVSCMFVGQRDDKFHYALYW